jgi:hypothetical protein
MTDSFASAPDASTNAMRRLDTFEAELRAIEREMDDDDEFDRLARDLDALEREFEAFVRDEIDAPEAADAVPAGGRR